MRGNDEKVVEIEIERLHDFKNHPFKVQADSQMKELQDSISKYGILNPLIVRPRPEGFYEVISGHRRKYAAMELKYTKVPVIISIRNTMIRQIAITVHMIQEHCCIIMKVIQREQSIQNMMQITILFLIRKKVFTLKWVYLQR